MKIRNDSLQRENAAKDREIRRLNKDAQQYEQTIINMRSKISISEYRKQDDVSKKDAEVMTCRSCTENEFEDWEPVKDRGNAQEDIVDYQKRILRMEVEHKSTCSKIQILRKQNTAISEELKKMRHVCAALNEECQVANARSKFKDEIIREMRLQLKQAKAKLKQLSDYNSAISEKGKESDHDFRLGSTGDGAFDSVTISCVRQQTRRKRSCAAAESLLRYSNDVTSAHDGSGDDVMSVQRN